MAFSDLREYMEALESAGELARVDREVDWRLEVGAVTRRTYEIGAPAIHFKRIKGYDSEYSLLGAPMGRGKRGIWSKLAVALELDPVASYQDIREEFVNRLSSPLKPFQVASGPCKENILKGDRVNLFGFPAPYLHDGDGGRYLGSLGTTITKDLDSEWVTWGAYRQMIHKKDVLGGYIPRDSHLGRIYFERYEPRDVEVPFAIALGCDPAVSMASAVQLPVGVNAANIAGGLRREPLQLVRCETNNLLVPASAEIVIEGVIPPSVRWDEGPFSELAGFRTLPRRPRPIYRVTCITHRDNPILPVSAAGVPIDDSQILTCMAFDAELLQMFRKKGWPVTNCFVPPWLAGNYVVVTARLPYPGFRDQVASAVRISSGGKHLPYVQICDADIEPTDINMVFHALATKCHPDHGVKIIKEAPGVPTLPFLSSEERLETEDKRKYARSSVLMLDSTWPLDWDPVVAVPPRASFDQIYPKEIQEKVLANWHSAYGFPGDYAETRGEMSGRRAEVASAG